MSIVLVKELNSLQSRGFRIYISTLASGSIHRLTFFLDCNKSSVLSLT